MENTNVAPKKKFRIPKLPKWARAAAVLVVAILGIIAVVSIVNAVSRNPAEKLFDNYLSAVKSQNPTKYAALFYKKGTDEYNDLVSNYKDGKTAYKNFLSANPKTGQNYKTFWDATNADFDNPAEYGLHLWAESQIAAGIKNYTSTVVRLNENYAELSIVLTGNDKFDGGVLPVRYRANGARLPEKVVISACKKNGKWVFGNEFSLFKAEKQDELDTWYAPYDNDGVELMHVGFENPKEGVFDISNWDFEGKPIVSIGDYAFSKRVKEVKKVILPAGLKNIGQYAFKDCAELTDIEFKDGGTGADKDITVGEGAFYGCKKLVRYDLSPKNKIIAPYLFFNCAALESFKIESAVNTIGQYAFYGCEILTGVDIPDTVTVIGDGAFEKCTGLVTLNNNNNVLSSKIIRLGSAVFKECSSLAAVTIPESISELNSALFQGCSSLVDVVLPQSLVRIGNNCFAGSGIVDVQLPKNVEFIGKGAFSGCNALSEFEWYKGANGENDARIRVIGESAFAGSTALYKFTLPASLKSLGAGAFLDCDNLRFVMLDCRYDIDMGERAFSMKDGIPKLYTKYNGEGTYLDIATGNSIKGDINLNNFNRTAVWTRLQLEIYSQSIIANDMAIMSQGGENTLIQYTGNAAVVDLSASEIHHINKGAFSHNTHLERLTINSAEIKSIGEDVFNGCSSKFFDSGFDHYKTEEGDLLYIGDWLIYGSYFKAAGGDVQLFGGKILNLTTFDTPFKLNGTGKAPATAGIAAMAFAVRGLSVNLAEVHLPKTLKHIGMEAFSGTSITALTFELEDCNLNTIGKGAFERCELLSSVELPKTHKTISDNAFYGCRGLRYVIVNSSETSVGILAFEYSYSLIKNADTGVVTEIREFYFDTLKLYIKDYNSSSYYKNDANWGVYQAFTYDLSIVSGNYENRCAILGNTVIQYLGTSAIADLGTGATAACNIVGAGAFAGSPIIGLTIGANVVRIEQNAFYSCEKLQQIKLKAGAGGSSALTYIGNYAFGNCKTLSNQMLDARDDEFGAYFNMMELNAPNAGFTMGQNVFDEDVNRKILVKNRKSFTGNSYWAAYSDALDAYDDPSITVYVHYLEGYEGDIDYTGKGSWVTTKINEPILGVTTEWIDATATPNVNDGYEFVGWFKGSANGEKVSGDLSYRIEFGEEYANDKYYAVFRRTQAYVKTKVDTGGGVIVDITGQTPEVWNGEKNRLYSVGDEIKLRADTSDTADYDYKFLGWYDSDGTELSTDREYTYKVTALDITVEAQFAVLRSRFAVSSDSGNATNGGTFTAVYEANGGNLSGGKEEPNTKIVFTASVNEGFVFMGWYLNGVRISQNPVYTFTKGSNVESMVARFRKIVNLTFSAVVFDKDNNETLDVGGSVEAIYEGDVYINDNPITLKATEIGKYKFYRWQYKDEATGKWVELGSTATMTNCPIPLATEIRAVFKLASQLTINITPEEGGTVDVTSGKQIIGDKIVLIAAPKDNYEFEGWYDADNKLLSKDEKYEYEVTDKDVVITAKFKKED